MFDPIKRNSEHDSIMDHGNHHHQYNDMMNDETTMSMKHDGQHHHHHHGHHGHHMMMTMGFTLHTSGHFLFEGLRINTVYGIAIAIVATSILTMFYEGCNSFVVSHMTVKGTKSSKQKQIDLLRHLLLTLLKTFAVFIGYVIMLGIMTYNVWILISVILGSGISHLLIRPFIYSHLRKHELHSDSARPEVEVLHDYPPDECENDTQEKNVNPTVETKLMEDYLSQDPRLISYKTYDKNYT